MGFFPENSIGKVAQRQKCSIKSGGPEKKSFFTKLLRPGIELGTQISIFEFSHFFSLKKGKFHQRLTAGGQPFTMSPEQLTATGIFVLGWWIYIVGVQWLQHC